MKSQLQFQTPSALEGGSLFLQESENDGWTECQPRTDQLEISNASCEAKLQRLRDSVSKSKRQKDVERQ